ncbi:MAG: heavy metal-associated domain-containing protein [Candidatus Micrarchaeota archaeon]
MLKISFKVNGIHCASCALKVEKTLKALNGVSSVSVNPVNNIASIDYDPKRVSVVQIKDSVKKAGYELV